MSTATGAGVFSSLSEKVIPSLHEKPSLPFADHLDAPQLRRRKAIRRGKSNDGCQPEFRLCPIAPDVHVRRFAAFVRKE
jgi:hypothetical protein